MDAILSRLPSQQSLHARAPAIAGFVFGAFVTLLAGLLASTIYTGKGLSHVPVQMEPIYTNF